MKTLFIILILMQLAPRVTCQKVSKSSDLRTSPAEFVLEQIEKFYSTHSYLYQEVKYSLFSDYNSSIPFLVEKGTYIRNSAASYSQLASIESLTTSSLSIGIDHDEKVVMISNTISIPATGPSAIIRSKLAPGTTMYLSGVSSQYGELIFSAEVGEIEEAKIHYERLTFQPIRIVLKYRAAIQIEADGDSPFISPRLEIEYIRTSFDKEGSDKLDIEAYLIKGKHEWTLAPALESYELIQTNQTLPNQ